MQQLPEALRDNVRFLGDLLGQIFHAHEGTDFFDKVEDIRGISKSLAQQEDADYQPLIDSLAKLKDGEILPLSRAFNQFLNLANIADQQYYASVTAQHGDGLKKLLGELKSDVAPAQLTSAIENLHIDLVLTAHPTEVSRRTLIHKYTQIIETLNNMARTDLLDYQRDKLRGRIYRLAEEIWTTDEIRVQRPTAIDEARWGFSVIEDSLWQAVPDFVRHLDRLSRNSLGKGVALNAKPFTFGSWMGGDRDGNPNVTHKVTEEVITRGRLRASTLYLKDIQTLITELSMDHASEDMYAYIDNADSVSPYRDSLSGLRHQLLDTEQWLEAKLAGQDLPQPHDLICSRQQILEPLTCIHQSLLDTHCDHIANGPLIDTIRRVNAFGINLSPIDIRQDADRHVQVIDELTIHLDMGSYREWPEAKRMDFLLEQLQSKRPILPRKWAKSEDTQEVLDTCRIIAEQPRETLANYVISMAEQASDVLAVALLLKESGMSWAIPIVPLFETLDDLNRSATVMNQLWQLHWYQLYTEGKQTVMIGYSDSAKDAGKLSATWAQYQAQEKLVSLADQYQINLTLFHGRGGTVGRGGGPVEKAMASQPPGSVKGHIRVTEQGEMIRYKFGVPAVAFNSLRTYVIATLKATLVPSPAPKPEWRQLLDEMAEQSLKRYRGIVREHPDFVPYFRSLTPEQELSKLAIGSRPAKRKASGGVESLRAIPWVFAWMQVRLNLPSWLGMSQAISYAQETHPELFQDMLENWSFFSSFIDLLEMVVGKADNGVCAHYEKQLVDPALQPLGKELRNDLALLEQQLVALKNQEHVLDSDPVLQNSINARKPYVDPLNYLQAELLKRERLAGEMSPELERALKVTMAGISAGMRNTG